jgi:hypothetical protein
MSKNIVPQLCGSSSEPEQRELQKALHTHGTSIDTSFVRLAVVLGYDGTNFQRQSPRGTMNTERKQAVAKRMIDHLEEKLTAMWEDGARYTTHDDFGEEVIVTNIDETIAVTNERILKAAKRDIQLILPLLSENHLEPDRLNRFVERYCQQAQKEIEESCEMAVRSAGGEDD